MRPDPDYKAVRAPSDVDNNLPSAYGGVDGNVLVQGHRGNTAAGNKEAAELIPKTDGKMYGLTPEAIEACRRAYV